MGKEGKSDKDGSFEKRPGYKYYNLRPLVGYDRHDPSRYRNPMYSMRQRFDTHKIPADTTAPGKPIDKLTAHGKHSPPAWSMSFRMKPSGLGKGPGPQTYNVKSPGPTPAYSCYQRRPINAKTIGPGPAYPIPTTIGPKIPDLHANPAFSIGLKTDPKFGDKTAPKYKAETDLNIYKHKAPTWKMGQRYDMKSTDTRPGPKYLPKFPQKEGWTLHNHTAAPYITPEDDMPCINR